MDRTPRYRLVPIDTVVQVNEQPVRWCGQAVLPGEQTVHSVTIDCIGDQWIAHQPMCQFDGWRSYSCPTRSGAQLCDSRCSPRSGEASYPVVRIGDDFFLAVDRRDDSASAAASVLNDELDALRKANRALEEQVLTVSRTMDDIINELSGQAQEIKAKAREQARLNEFVRRVMDTMDNLLVVLDRFGQISRVNKSACNHFGRDEGALIGQSADGLLSVADRAELARDNPNAPPGLLLFQAATARGGLSVELGLGGLSDGEGAAHKVFFLRGAAIYDGAGKMEGAVIVATDVTQLRERERMLEESEDRFRDYSSMSTTWLWQTDEKHYFVPIEKDDPHYETLFKGKHVRDMALPGTPLPNEWLRHLERMDARETFRDWETEGVSPNGPCWYSISGRPMYVDGRFIGYRGTAKDVTQRKAMEEELVKHRDHLSDLVREQTADLIEAKESAEHANRMKSEFLSNISHELRTPLHSIMSFSRLGIKKAPDSQQLDKITGYFERIHASGSRLTGLVDDLLNLAKLESGKILLDLSIVDLGKLVSDVSGTLEALLISRGQHIEIDNRLDNQAVRIDPNRFSQVLLNLIGNASKFAPSEKPIEVSLGAATLPSGEAAFRLNVADHGPGVPEDELEDIFGKFVQSSRTKTGAGGTGLGLAICRQIIMAHGGTITASNRAEGGAIFEVLMPMETAFEARAPEAL